MTKKICFDIDGTICPVKDLNQPYNELPPDFHFLEKMREYKKAGFIIVLFTARNMGTYKDNLGKINIHTLPGLIEWLNLWDIPYDELYMGKQHCLFYIDDKAVRPEEFKNLSYSELLELTGQEWVKDAR